MKIQHKIKAIAIDLDGTLLTTQKKITEATINTLRYAMDMGIHVVIATGRGLHSAMDFVEQVGTPFPLICYNGSCIYDHKNKKDLWHSTLDTDISAELITLGKQTDAHLHAYANHELYFLEEGKYADYLEPISSRIGNVTTFKQTDSIRFTKAMFIGEKETTEIIRKQLQKKFGDRLYMVYSHDYYFEIMAGGVTKGSALKHLMDMYSITADETMAFGDADNDREMLAWARYSVAMGNAHTRVKQTASFTAGHNDEEGVAKKIQKMLGLIDV